MKLRHVCSSLAFTGGLVLAFVPNLAHGKTTMDMPPATAPTAPTMATPPLNAKQQKIKKLMDVTAAGDIGIQVMNQTIQRLKTVMPGGSEAFWAEFQKQVNANELVALIIPIYEKHFSEEDIDNVTKFFESPTGKKFISEMPQIMQEAMAAGEKWGEKIANQAKLQLEKQKKTK